MNKEKKVIRLGTRKSPLAMAQARLAAEAIERAFPELTAELVPIVTRGDRILDRPLVEFGGKGAFISEFERALLEGRINGAVHSAKDMPEELAKGLVIAAALPREDAGDVLVTVKGRPLPDGPFLVGTGSPRRQVQIREMSNARCALLRGNIQTRLNKLREGEYDAILLAAAGLKRMGLLSDPEFSFERLPEKEFIPAGGQGIIAVESREHTEFFHVFAAINDPAAFRSLAAERLVLKRLGAGCTGAVGVYSYSENGSFHIKLMKGTENGILRREISGTPEEYEALAAAVTEGLDHE